MSEFRIEQSDLIRLLYDFSMNDEYREKLLRIEDNPPINGRRRSPDYIEVPLIESGPVTINNNEYQLPQRTNLFDFMRLRPPNYMRITTFEDMYKHISIYDEGDLIERIDDITAYLDRIVSSARDEHDASFANGNIDEYDQALERYSDSSAIYNIVSSSL